MNKLIGLRVYCAIFGAGEIQSYRDKNDFPITVKFDSEERSSYTHDGRILNRANPTLSLTPYTLEKGDFTPLSEFNRPKVGDWGWFWDNDEVSAKSVRTGELESIGGVIGEPFKMKGGNSYENFSKTLPEFIKEKILESIKLAQ